MNRVRLRKERRALMKSIHGRTHALLKKFPELADDKEFVKSYFEKKLGYKPPKPYHELIRKPRPDELRPGFKKRLGMTNAEKKFYDEEF